MGLPSLTKFAGAGRGTCPSLWCGDKYRMKLRIDAFELWCWRRLLRILWTARRSNQSILKEISPEYSLERLMLKLKFQCFSHLMRTADSLEKTLMLGKVESRRRKGWQKMKWLDGITDSMDMSLSKLQKMVKVGETWRAAAHGVAKSQTPLSDWTSSSESEFFSISRHWKGFYSILCIFISLSSLLPSIGMVIPTQKTGDTGSISGSERSPGEGNDNPLQYSSLGNALDRGAWQAPVTGVAKESDRT